MQDDLHYGGSLYYMDMDRDHSPALTHIEEVIVEVEEDPLFLPMYLGKDSNIQRGRSESPKRE